MTHRALPLLLAIAALAPAVGRAAPTSNPIISKDNGVLSDGSFSYRLPIKLPRGLNGLQPELSLVYNSNHGNGPLGLRWRLHGLSAVRRVNTGSGVRYAGQDAYAGPEGRLVPVPEIVNTVYTTIYHPARETWTRYLPQGKCGDGPCWWKAERRDGKKLYFGSGTSTRQLAVGKKGSVRVWPLDRVVDARGLHYDIEYHTDGVNGDFYPKRITYTKGGPGALRTVDFVYEARSDSGRMFVDSAVEDVDRRLRWIVVRSNGKLVRKIELGYGASDVTGRSLLRTVHEVGSDGETTRLLAAFDWDGHDLPKLGLQLDAGWQAPTVCLPVPDVPYLRSFPSVSDFNGDGFDDFATLFYNAKEKYLNLVIDGSTGSAFDGKLGWATMMDFDAANAQLIGGDFDGDGSTDLARAVNDGGKTTIEVFLSTRTGFAKPVKWAIKADYWGKQLAAGDFTGDGKTDIVSYSLGSGSLQAELYISTGSAFVYSAALKNVPFNGKLSDVSLGDFDGDGRTDLASHVIGAGGWWIDVYRSTGTKLVHEAKWGYNQGTPGTTHRFRTGDFNGDGKTDLLRFWDDGGKLSADVHLSTGSRFELQAWLRKKGAAGDLRRLKTGDFNGDGKTDLVHLDLGNLYLSTGRFDFPGGGLALPAWGAGVKLGCSMIGDFNGDGTTDLMRSDGIAQGVYTLNRNGPASPLEVPHDVITRFKNDVGGALEVAHTPAPQVQGAVRPDLGGSGRAFKHPRLLVTETRVSGGSEQASACVQKTRYEYANGRYSPGNVSSTWNPVDHSHVLVGEPANTFLGFQWIRRVELASQQETVTRFRQDEPFERQVARVEAYAGNKLLRSKTMFSYKAIGNCGGGGCTGQSPADLPNMLLPYTQKIYTYEPAPPHPALLKIETAVNTFDLFGNNVASTKVVKNADLIEVHREHHESQVINNRVPNVIGLVYSRKSCRDPSCLKLYHHERLYFDNQPLGAAGAQRALTKKEVLLGGVWAAESFTHDAAGNVIQTQHANGTQVTTIYDATFGIYPAEITDAAGHATLKTHDDRFDVVVSSTDANNVVTKRTLGAFGRPVTELTRVGGATVAKKTFGYSRGSAANDAYWDETCAWDLAANVKYCGREHRDGMDRLYRKASVGDGGKQVIQLSEYSCAEPSKLSRRSEPFFAGAAKKHWTAWTYDSAGRVGKTVLPNGSVLLTAYNEVGAAGVSGAVVVKTTTDPRGHRTRIWSDFLGKAVRTTQGLGTGDESTVQRSFDCHLRKPLTTLDPNGNLTKIVYDADGRVTSQTIPGMGTFTYAYHKTPGVGAFGRLSHEKYAGANPGAGVVTKTFQYDAFGRPTGYATSNGIVKELAYDETKVQNGLGRITSSLYQADGYRIEKLHAYDAFGKVASTAVTLKETATNTVLASWTTGKKLDSLQRIAERSYPDSSVLGYAYHPSSGLPKALIAGTVVHASYTDYDPRGQAGTVTYANKVENGRVYDDRTGQLAALVTARQGASPQVLQHREYDHDGNGNVTDARDLLKPALSYGYFYDPLNRLREALRADKRAFHYDFDPGGNLVNNDGQGQAFGPGNVPVQAGGEMLVFSGRGTLVERMEAGAWQSYVYNDEARLIHVEVNGAPRAHYVYDEAGRRVLKISFAGKIERRTYYLGDAYEVREKRVDGACTERTAVRHIVGPDGKRVASESRPRSCQAAVAALDSPGAHRALASMYAPGDPRGWVARHYHLAAAALEELGPRRALGLLLVALTAALVLAIYLRNVRRRRSRRCRTRFSAAHPLLARVNLGVLAAFLLVTGCGGQEPATRSAPLSASAVRYYSTDHLGSVTVVTDGAGTALSSIHYTPFGAIDETTSKGAGVSSTEFTGQEHDGEVGLYYYKSRYYDPGLGLFVQPDSEVPGEGTQDTNRFMYAAGNPVTFCDPSGHFWTTLIYTIVFAVLGAIFGGTNGMPFLPENWSNFNVRGAIFGFLNGALSGFLLGAMDLTFFHTVTIHDKSTGLIASIMKSKAFNYILSFGGATLGLFSQDHETSFWLQFAFASVAYPIFLGGHKLWMSGWAAYVHCRSALDLVTSVGKLAVALPIMWVGKGLMYTKTGIGVIIGLVNFLDSDSEDEEAPINSISFVSASAKPAG
jgi:RHS repeat-associated protein